MDETEVERRVRAGLERRAEAADVTAPVLARAREEVVRRRRARWGTVAAAAAVVLVLGGVAVATRDGDGRGEAPAADDPGRGALPGETAGWRTEYWADVAVDVPAEWGYGGAPMRSGGDTIACWPEAMVGADGARLEGTRLDEGRTRGWVGRPILLTDVCTSYPPPDGAPHEQPTAPYVWLGAAVEPGIVEYDGGFVQETVEVNGSTVTVGSYDADLRNRILASVRGGELCLANVSSVPRGRTGLTYEGRDALLAAEVCAYRREAGGDFWLSYAAALEAAEVEAAFAAAEAAPAYRVDCDEDAFELVVVRATYDDPFGEEDLERAAVYHMRCGGTVDLGGGVLRRMTPESVEPWAVGGIPAVVVGPTGGKGAMLDSFIGRQG